MYSNGLYWKNNIMDTFADFVKWRFYKKEECFMKSHDLWCSGIHRLRLWFGIYVMVYLWRGQHKRKIVLLGKSPEKTTLGKFSRQCILLVEYGNVDADLLFNEMKNLFMVSRIRKNIKTENKKKNHLEIKSTCKINPLCT